MKKLNSFLIAALMLTGISCLQKANPENDKEAVLKVLQQEGDDFAKSNKEGVYGLHVQDASATRLDGSKVYSGWSAIRELYEKYFVNRKSDTISRNMRNMKENVIVKTDGNCAWVVCDNIWKWEVNGQNQSFRNKQIAVFEKQDGQWKFALNAFVEGQNPLIGAWNLIYGKYLQNGSTVYDYPKGNLIGKDMKIWTNSYFSFVGKFMIGNKELNNYGGGTYTLNGNRYEENILYHTDASSVGASVKMMLEIKGDTLIQTWPVDANGNFDKSNYSVEKYIRLN